MTKNNKRIRVSINEEVKVKEYLNQLRNNHQKKEYNVNNVLIIGDLHQPFEHPLYFEHCKRIRDKYLCGTIVLIGDVLDNHFSSYHEQVVDGMGALDELNKAISNLEKWHNEFPNAIVTIGNHDRIAVRKANTSLLSSFWIKDLKDVLKTPSWTYVTDYQFNNVLYYHGENSTNILSTLQNKRQNIVCGHIHSKHQIQYSASEKDLIWGMHVGCGIDIKKYAFEYAKFDLKRPIIGCAVVVGNQPILEPLILT